MLVTLALSVGSILNRVLWWCHDMETLSSLLVLYVGNPYCSLIDTPRPHKGPVMQSFDDFFVIQNFSNKLSSFWWFETPRLVIIRHHFQGTLLYHIIRFVLNQNVVSIFVCHVWNGSVPLMFYVYMLSIFSKRVFYDRILPKSVWNHNMAWERFPNYWPFMRGMILLVTGGFPLQRTSNVEL